VSPPRGLTEKGNTAANDNDSSMANVSVQRQVLAILEDADSDFAIQWSGEIYPKQMEWIRQALGCDGVVTTILSTSTHDD
jgi:hypothetical protein